MEEERSASTLSRHSSLGPPGTAAVLLRWVPLVVAPVALRILRSMVGNLTIWRLAILILWLIARVVIRLWRRNRLFLAFFLLSTAETSIQQNKYHEKQSRLEPLREYDLLFANMVGGGSNQSCPQDTHV